MFSFFKKQKWMLVKTITVDQISWAGEKGGKIFIHLYESDKGNRKMESACSFSEATQEKIDTFIKSKEFYQTKIHRWLAGRYDPEIPRYSEIGEEDTVNALRGKVE
jgi:hypothetical protein